MIKEYYFFNGSILNRDKNDGLNRERMTSYHLQTKAMANNLFYHLMDYQKFAKNKSSYSKNNI